MPRDELLTTANKLLDIPADILADALGMELEERVVAADRIGDRECIFLAHLWQAERLIANRLRELATGRPPWGEIDPGKGHCHIYQVKALSPENPDRLRH